MKLKQTKQCKTCPWIKGNDPFNIPNGYSEELHKNLDQTIAQDLRFGCSLKSMACHYSNKDDENYCIGWLNNQLGVGNNIGLRFKMMDYSNLKDVKLLGEQHSSFEDTLPENQ